MKLYPTLPLIEGESLPSWVSRLAKINGRTLGQFCTDMRISVYRMVDGCASALSELAYMASADLEMLLGASFRREVDGWRLNDERLVKGTLRRDHLLVCPKCLLDDAEVGGETNMYGRTVWSLAPIKTCAVHGLALVDLGASPSNDKTHDFALRIGIQGPDLKSLAATASPRLASPLEDYLIARLGHRERTPVEWLDSLEWHAAATTCDVLGAVSLFGREANLKAMSIDDWRRAGGEGFAIASGGRDAVQSFLSDLYRSFPFDRSALHGPQAVYGKIYKWAAFSARDSSFDAVREVIRDGIKATFPLAPGDLIFGKPVHLRTIHSIRTASVESGLHPKRLRKILAAKAILPADHASKADGNVLFDAVAAEPVLLRAAHSLSEEEVTTYLNSGRVQTAVLRRDGFITPWLEGNSQGLGDAAFDRRDLDAFLIRLLERASDVSDRGDTWCDIPLAAKRSNCGAGEIVGAILNGSLKSVGRDPAARGYMSALVRLDEVRRLVRGAPLGGLTAQQVQIRLGTTHRVTKAILDRGLLPVSVRINPLNRCPVKVVDVVDFERFASMYALASEVSRAWKTHPVSVRTRLLERGVVPAFKKSDFATDIYRRSEIELP